MILLPFRHINIDTQLSTKQINKLLIEQTDSGQPAIYWRRTFHKPLWGNIRDKSFTVRPVVPYWNISPIHISGQIKETNNARRVSLRITSPSLRVILPLIFIAITLLILTYYETQAYDIILSLGGSIIGIGYLMIIIPFQIQLDKTLKLFRNLLK